MAKSFVWKWEKKSLTSPVTSVEFVGDLVLTGNGPFLSVYSATRGNTLDSKCLLKRSRIHGIRVEQNSKKLVAIFGQKVVRVVRLQEDEQNSQISLEAMTDVVPFPDLLWDLHWLYHQTNEAGMPNIVVIATAHNAVWCWDWERNVKQTVAQCEESCILYSARFFGSHLDHLVIASGTVFNQILLWKVQGKKNEMDRTKILQRLSGHEGVIFSINFNKTGTLLGSVSDDRSIRLWKITDLLGLASDGCIEASLVVYGHTARVWDCRLLETCFVSIGEDLICNVWSYEGKVVKSFKGHTGRNIWSLAVNTSEDLIATGGGDGRIRLWPLMTPEHQSSVIMGEACLPSASSVTDHQTNKKKHEKGDYPRFVSVVDAGNLLIMTNDGCLYKHNWLKDENMEENRDDVPASATECSNSEDNWTLLLEDKQYSTYSVVSLSPCRTMIAFGNLQGKIKLQHLDFKCPNVELQAYSGKVHNVLWSSQHSPQHLFSCGPDGQLIWWHIKLNLEESTLSVRPLCSFYLPPSKQRWASAVEIFLDPLLKQCSEKEKWTDEYLLVCGDRKGSLHLFDPKKAVASVNETITPSHTLPLIHGKAGVSHVCIHDGHLYSAGRDGVYRQYRMQRNTLELIDTKKVFKGLDWVERLTFTADGDLLIAGFHAAFFVLWSVRRNELLWRVKCGGAHRAWDLFLQQTSECSLSEAVLSYIKDSRICTHKMTLRNELSKAVLKPGFHGREATCICYIDSTRGKAGDMSDVFATGSEDTNINLLISSRKTGVTTRIFTAHGHISSVRALSATKYYHRNIQRGHQMENHANLDGSCYLLFSGGGRASLKCWRVNLSLIELSNDSFHGDKMMSSPIVYLGEYSFRLSNHKRRRKKTDDHTSSEIRFMSLTSLSAGELISPSLSDDMIDSCQSLYFVMAACSDGFVRIFCFDTRLNKFFLLAQSQYLKRCVLTVNLVIDRFPNGKTLVLLLAGDTAGKISCWDVFTLLMKYLEECCEKAREEKISITRTLKETSKQAVVEASAVSEEETVKIASLAKCDKVKALEHVTDCHNKESVTDCHAKGSVTECHAKGSMTDCHAKKSLTDFHAKGSVTDCHAKGNVTKESDTKEGVTRTCINEVKPGTVASEELISGCVEREEKACKCTHQLLHKRSEGGRGVEVANCEDPREYSCAPLVSSFLSSPNHEFKAHQSGVNDLSLVKIKEPGRYRLVSGGDDGALYTAEIDLMLTNENVTEVHVTCEASLPSAHTSSVTGVKALNDGLVISSSVDQRLILWEIANSDQVASPADLFHQRAVEFVDVADVQDLEVWGERDDCVTCAVCGVGLQTFRLLQSIKDN